MRVRPPWPFADKRLTLLGRATVLLAGELVANVICWVAAALTLRQGDGLLGLALLAWTIGLRHGLDADHISAIDNATRQLVSLGQLPMTCGLWFSLGHSTIVIAVTIAIAIGVDIYDKLDTVGSIGGIVGTSVSAAFLFLIACINIFFLHGAIKQRRRVKGQQVLGLPSDPAPGQITIQGGGCLVRILGPILRAVDRPWKMYPVGILFGFGFDTASSIALLAISAITQKGTNGEEINHGKIVILPFLFTAGMSLVDSLDSVLMLYAYAMPKRDQAEGKLALFYSTSTDPTFDEAIPLESAEVGAIPAGLVSEMDGEPVKDVGPRREDQMEVQKQRDQSPSALGVNALTKRIMDSKASTISSLSITLTLLSILVALSISLIEIMGLIGDNCEVCSGAANDPDGGGLAGSWWRFWAGANDQSGYIGAAIVGGFIAILAAYHGGRWGWRRLRRRKRAVQRLGQSNVVGELGAA